MTIEELKQSLREAVAANRIGAPVSLRLHLQLADSKANLAAISTLLRKLADELFVSTIRNVLAQSSTDGRQLNILVEYQNGRTCILTVGSGSAQAASLHVLLVGNHGVIRLEGGEDFDESCLHAVDRDDEWAAVIASSR